MKRAIDYDVHGMLNIQAYADQYHKPRSHLTMHRTIGLTDYYRNRMNYQANGLVLGLGLGVRKSPLVRCIIKCDPINHVVFVCMKFSHIS